MTKPIQFQFKGSIDNLRALLSRLAVQHPEGWPAGPDERVKLMWMEVRQYRNELVAVTTLSHPFATGCDLPDLPGVPIEHIREVDVTPSTRGTWAVWAGEPTGFQDADFQGTARLEAFEERSNLLTVIIQNGIWPWSGKTCKLIDPLLLEKLSQMITEEEKESVKEGSEGERRDSRVVVIPDLAAGGKYGTCRDVTAGQVQDIVNACREFMDRGGKVTDFYDAQGFDPASEEPGSYTLETLRGWLKNPRFTPRGT